MVVAVLEAQQQQALILCSEVMEAQLALLVLFPGVAVVVRKQPTLLVEQEQTDMQPLFLGKENT